MGQRNTLAAVLVGCHLRNDLGGNVAGGGKAMGLINASTRNNSAVLQHILQVHQVAVVHVLGKIICIMEVDQTIFMCFNNFWVQQQTSGQIL